MMLLDQIVTAFAGRTRRAVEAVAVLATAGGGGKVSSRAVSDKAE